MSVSTSVRREFSGRSGVVEGKMNVTMARVQDLVVEFKSIAPRLAMLEGRADPRGFKRRES